MDLISRQEAIDALNKHFAKRLRQFDYDSYEQADDNTRRVCDGLVDAMEVVDNLPSVQSERKTGKWIPENRTIDAFWVCSACGFPSEAHAANILYHYCPNCGADMREGQDE